MTKMLDRLSKPIYLSAMNKLPIEKRVQIIQLLVEGNSIRSCTRIADVSKNTVVKLLVDVGIACMNFHDRMVVNMPTKKLQCDEIWSFVYAKQKKVKRINKPGINMGDVWTWVAIDADTKMVVSWFVGPRNTTTAINFMKDVSSRIKDNSLQITTDGFTAYPEAVRIFFDNPDFAVLDKQYGSGYLIGKMDRRRQYIGANKITISGNPDPKHISTSFVERQNLTMRTNIKRFTRQTNAFSKKVENHCYAIALHFIYYNFVRIHKSLRVPPAMETGLIKRLMTIEDIVNLSDK